MSKRPLVSVIIPGYKGEYICQTIDSILSQSYKNIEIIVVDDGSPENLRNILDTYILNGYIRYISQENRKMAAAKNKGVGLSHGDYVAFLDDDDIWLSTKVEKQIELFEKEKDVGLVYTFANGFFEENTVSIPNFEIENRGYIYSQLFRNDFISNSSVMVRRSVLDKVGLFEEGEQYYGVDDSNMWLRILYNHKAEVVPEKLVSIRFHNNRYSGNKLAMYKKDLFVKNEILKKYPVSNRYIREYYSRVYFEMGFVNRKQNSIKSIKYYLLSMYYRPRVKTAIAAIKSPLHFIIVRI